MTRKEAEKAVRKVISQKIAMGMKIPKGAFKDSVEALLKLDEEQVAEQAAVIPLEALHKWSDKERHAVEGRFMGSLIKSLQETAN